MASSISTSGDKVTENRIAQAINEIPLGVAVIDPRRRFRFRNTLFERMHDYLLLPAPVQSLEGLMQAIQERVTSVLGERGQDVSLHTYTYQVTSRNGSLRIATDTGIWYEYSFAPFGDYDTLITCRNVTHDQVVRSELKDIKYRYERFYDRLPALIHSVNAEGRILNVSQRWLETFGYERHEVVGRKITRFVSEKTRPLAEQILKKFVAMDEVQNVRYQMLCKNGDVVDVLMSAIPELDQTGKLIRSLSVLNLSDTQQNREEGLQMVRELAMTSLNHLGDAVVTVNRSGQVSFINQVAERMTGWLAQEAVGQPVDALIRLQDSHSERGITNPLKSALESGQVVNLLNDTVLLSRQGAEFQVELSATPIWGGDTEVVGAVLLLRDVSQIVQTRRKLAFYSQLDPLTRLPNRNTFTQSLAAAFESVRKSGGQFALLFIDIDRFRMINDLYGHSGGDLVIRQVAHVLRARAQKGDYLARIGEDTFAIVLRNPSREAAVAFAEKFRRAVGTEDFDCGGGNRARVTLSIGVTLMGRISKGPQSALAEAESACKLAKDKGRNRVQFYESSDEGARRHQTGMVWVNQINESVRNNQMRLLAMPVQALQDGADTRVRAEALLRMIDSTGNLISPQQFLPAAEHYQVVESVDRWVVQHVFELLAARPSLEGIDFLAVNLSGHSVLNADFLEFLRDLAGRYPAICPHICFEIVESAVVSNLPEATGFMEAVSAMGCRIALDDFGRQASAFSYLRNLKLDYVRFEGGYVQNLLNDSFDLTIIRAMNELVHGLGKQSIAERVESEDILLRLRELGVDYAQGFHIGRPVPLVQLLEQARTAPAEAVLTAPDIAPDQAQAAEIAVSLADTHIQQDSALSEQDSPSTVVEMASAPQETEAEPERQAEPEAESEPEVEISETVESQAVEIQAEEGQTEGSQAEGSQAEGSQAEESQEADSRIEMPQNQPEAQADQKLKPVPKRKSRRSRGSRKKRQSG